MNIEDYVEFFEWDGRGLLSGSIMFPDTKQYKGRLIIGFKVRGMDRYWVEKRGGIQRITKEMIDNGENIGRFVDRFKVRFIEAASIAWQEISAQEEWTLTIPMYGYHFGMPYEVEIVDDEERIIGKWPMVAKMKVYAEKIFLMKSGYLPEEWKHLCFFRFPEPTGKRIERRQIKEEEE